MGYPAGTDKMSVACPHNSKQATITRVTPTAIKPRSQHHTGQLQQQITSTFVVCMHDGGNLL